jgi:hypothetical protein
MIPFPVNVAAYAASHFLSTSAGALVVAVVASAVVGFIVWWAVALVVSFLALTLWRLRRRLRPEGSLPPRGQAS